MATTPLTKTPYSQLTEQANIETTLTPSVVHLEKSTIPRFSSLSAATAAFNDAPPELHQLRFVSSKGAEGLEIYNGTSWVEYHTYSLTRDITFVKDNAQERQNTVAASIAELGVPVVAGAVYTIEGYFIYWAPFGTTAAFGFNFPGTGSRASVGSTYRSALAIDSPDADRVRITNMTQRVSGDIEHVAGGRSDSLTGIPFIFSGTLRSEGSGTFQPTFRRESGPGDAKVHIFRDSWIRLKRVR